LQPAGSKSYLQPFTVITGAKLKEGNRLEVQNGAQKKELKLNQDFVPFSFSSSAEVRGPLVFAGYGASANEFSYDDYAHLDVKDKIVVLLRYEPAGFAAKSGNSGLTQHSQLITKAINARNHGAKASHPHQWEAGRWRRGSAHQIWKCEGPENAGIVIAQAKNDVARPGSGRQGSRSQGVQNANRTHPQLQDSFAFPGVICMFR
jgi:hypothetical protein